MNFILSIFLCLAMAFGGVSELPAVPETATTWTIRNLSFTDGVQEYALDPEARITTAVSADSASLHFELGSDGKTLLPITAELTSSALRATFGSNERVYSFSDEEFAKAAGLDASTANTMDTVAAFLRDYGAVVGALTGGGAIAQENSEKIYQILYDACGAEPEEIEVEVEGQSLPGAHVTLQLTPENLMAFIDALREKIPEFGRLFDAVLNLGNSSSGTSYAIFSEMLQSEGGSAPSDFNFPLEITAAAGADLQYARIESSLSGNGEQVMTLSEEVVMHGSLDDAQVDATLHTEFGGAATDGNSVTCDATMQTTGPVGDPTAEHAEFTMIADSQLPSDDGEPEIMHSEARILIDGTNTDGLHALDAQMELSTGAGAPVNTTMRFVLEQQSEADGSVTSGVSLSASQGSETFGVSFDVNRSEAAPVDYFAGAQEIPLTMAALNDSESPDAKVLMASLQTDAMKLYLDAMQLMADPSVQAIAGEFEQAD